MISVLLYIIIYDIYIYIENITYSFFFPAINVHLPSLAGDSLPGPAPTRRLKRHRWEGSSAHRVIPRHWVGAPPEQWGAQHGLIIRKVLFEDGLWKLNASYCHMNHMVYETFGYVWFMFGFVHVWLIIQVLFSSVGWIWKTTQVPRCLDPMGFYVGSKVVKTMSFLPPMTGNGGLYHL